MSDAGGFSDVSSLSSRFDRVGRIPLQFSSGTSKRIIREPGSNFPRYSPVLRTSAHQMRPTNSRKGDKRVPVRENGTLLSPLEGGQTYDGEEEAYPCHQSMECSGFEHSHDSVVQLQLVASQISSLVEFTERAVARLSGSPVSGNNTVLSEYRQIHRRSLASLKLLIDAACSRLTNQWTASQGMLRAALETECNLREGLTRMQSECISGGRESPFSHPCSIQNPAALTMVSEGSDDSASHVSKSPISRGPHHIGQLESDLKSEVHAMRNDLLELSALLEKKILI